MQNKNFSGNTKSLQKIMEPNRKRKVIYTDNALEFGKACEDLSWNHCTSTPHRSEVNGIAERAVRRIKEGTFAVLLQSGLTNPNSAQDLSRLHQFGPKVLPSFSLDIRCTREESGKETSWSPTLMNWRRWTHLESMRKDSMQSKCLRL